MSAQGVSSIVWSFDVSEVWGEYDVPGQFSASDTFLDSSGNLIVDKLYVEQTTLSAGSSKVLTLSSLTDPFQNSFSFSRINLIFVQVPATSPATPSLKFGGSGSNPFGNGTLFTDGSSSLTVRNGGVLKLTASDSIAYSVMANSSDQLLLTNLDGANPCQYNLVLLGHS